MCQRESFLEAQPRSPRSAQSPAYMLLIVFAACIECGFVIGLPSLRGIVLFRFYSLPIRLARVCESFTFVAECPLCYRGWNRFGLAGRAYLVFFPPFAWNFAVDRNVLAYFSIINYLFFFFLVPLSLSLSLTSLAQLYCISRSPFHAIVLYEREFANELVFCAGL